MKLKEKKIAIITGPNFEDSELIYPFYRFREAQADVIVSGVGKKGEILKGKNGVKVEIHTPVHELNFDNFHCAVIPGGFAPDYFRADERVQAFLHHVHSRGGIVAAICHGPWALISAGLLKGHECTSYYTIRDDVVDAGGKWQDTPVVVDNRLITSRCPEDLPDFCLAIIESVSKLNF
jgi:protease I